MPIVSSLNNETACIKTVEDKRLYFFLCPDQLLTISIPFKGPRGPIGPMIQESGFDNMPLFVPRNI